MARTFGPDAQLRNLIISCLVRLRLIKWLEHQRCQLGLNCRSAGEFIMCFTYSYWNLIVSRLRDFVNLLLLLPNEALLTSLVSTMKWGTMWMVHGYSKVSRWKRSWDPSSAPIPIVCCT